MTDTAGDDPAARLVGADRVLAVLLELGEHPRGVTLDSLSATLDSPKPTIHRALGALKRAGLALQTSRGTYMLGDEFLRIAFRNFAERPESELVTPILERLAARFGETAHYAVLSGTDVVYRAKADPPSGAVRLTSVVGGRNPAHCTAVGKLLLSESVETRQQLGELLGPGPLPRRTPHTITDIGALWRELETIRERGYAVDAEENEEGINCIAIPFGLDAGLPQPGAVSISALAFRTPLDTLVDRLAEIAALAAGR